MAEDLNRDAAREIMEMTALSVCRAHHLAWTLHYLVRRYPQFIDEWRGVAAALHYELSHGVSLVKNIPYFVEASRDKGAGEAGEHESGTGGGGWVLFLDVPVTDGAEERRAWFERLGRVGEEAIIDPPVDD